MDLTTFPPRKIISLNLQAMNMTKMHLFNHCLPLPLLHAMVDRQPCIIMAGSSIIEVSLSEPYRVEFWSVCLSSVHTICLVTNHLCSY